MKLSDSMVKSLKPGPRPQKIGDGSGLYLYISPTGAKSFRYAYRFDGKQKVLTFGRYPGVGLMAAREMLLAARVALARGEDPGAKKQVEKRAARDQSTFGFIAEKFFELRRLDWSEATYTSNLGRYRMHLAPYLADRPIRELRAPEILGILRKPEAKGTLETIKRCRVIVQQVFGYAMAIGEIDSDPTGPLASALPRAQPGHHAAPTEPAEVGRVLRLFDACAAHATIRHAALLAPLVAVRPGELRGALWADFDFGAKEWRFIASKTKQPHIVPLSRQALAILDAQRAVVDGLSPYVFPTPRDPRRPLSDGGLGAMIKSLGLGQVITPHGWRAVFRTLGAERCGFPREWLEMQLAHSVPDALGRAYNRTQWLDQRREMMQRWADYLDELRGIQK